MRERKLDDDDGDELDSSLALALLLLFLVGRRNRHSHTVARPLTTAKCELFDVLPIDHCLVVLLLLL